MFTVIFLSDSARAVFEPARVYFEPFEEAGLIAFCDWDQSPRARTMEEATPGLPAIIQGHESWRAVIVDHPRGEIETPHEQRRDVENPFDFLDNVDPSLNLEDSKHPLVRLAHILLGYPQMTAKRFEAYLTYENADTGESVEGTARDLLIDFVHKAGLEAEYAGVLAQEHSEEEWFRLANSAVSQKHNKVRRLFKEIEYSAPEQELHQELRARYRMKEVRPTKAVFVATRADTEEDEKLQLKRAWNVDSEQNSSRFVERNDYPPLSRFAAYELLDPENSGYEQDLLRFWLSVLTIATNQLPPGGFQSERVYEIGVDFDKTQLADMLNAHISQLAMVRDHLDQLILAPQRPPNMEVRDLLTPVETRVVFDDMRGEMLQANQSGYGLVTDVPHDEQRRWNAEIGRVGTESTLFMRKPRRAVGRAVSTSRELSHLDSNDKVLSLNDCEREELGDELARRLPGLVVPTTVNILDRNRLQRTIDAGAQRVRSEISVRMKMRTVILAVGVSLGIWLAAFLPYIIQSFQRSGSTVVSAIALVLIVLIAIAVTGIVLLLWLRERLRKEIQKFNDDVHKEVASVRVGANEFAKYLSKFVIFRRGSERLRGAERERNHQIQRLRKTMSLREHIVMKIEKEKEIVRGLGAAIEVHRTTRGLVEFDPDDDGVERQLFRFPEGERLIPFNESGEYVTAPYDFVTKLYLRRLVLFEAHEGENN